MTDSRRIGIVDMGSNAIRTEIVEVEGSSIRTIERNRAAIRLGGDVFSTGSISEPVIECAIQALLAFRASCDDAGVERIKAIATSATREASNRADFVARIERQTGIVVEPIDGLTEAHYLRCAVETKLDVSVGMALLVDFGGGSVEIVRLDHGELRDAESYPLGSIRLLESLGEHAASTGDALIEHFQFAMRIPLAAVSERFEGTFDYFIATGGNIETIAELLARRRSPAKVLGTDALRRKEVATLTRDLANLSQDDRMRDFGLQSDRADTIVPAGLVYVALARIAGAQRIVVPRVGVRRGLRIATVRGDEPPTQLPSG